MCAYREPEVYVKLFVGRALPGIPYVRIKADYGVENIVIEANSPLRRVKDRASVVSSLPSNTYAFVEVRAYGADRTLCALGNGVWHILE